MSWSTVRGIAVAGLQWTFQYAASSIAAVSMIASPALTAAGKSISCAGSERVPRPIGWDAFPHELFRLHPCTIAPCANFFLFRRSSRCRCLPRASAQAQQAPGSAEPKVRVNYLNVCSPSAEDRQQIAGALERIPAHPKFAVDFEVARGRSTLSGSDLLAQNTNVSSGEASVSDWVQSSQRFSCVIEFRQCAVFVQCE